VTLESIKNITVDLSNSGTYNDKVTAMRGDNGTRYVYVTVLNNGHEVDLSNTYPVLRGTKSDGTTVFNQCTIEDGMVIVELTSQILAAPGIGQFEIALYELVPVEGEPAGKIIAAFPFQISVVDSSFDAVNIVSSDEYTVLAEAMENIPSIASVQEFEDMVTDLEDRIDTQIGNYTIGVSVPANAVFTDTTYGNATSSADGLMSKENYSKLTGVETGAEANQNAYSIVVAGSTQIVSSAKTDTLTISGTNVTITGNASTKEIGIGINGANVTDALGYTPASLDQTGKIPTSELPSGIGSIVTASETNGNIVVDGNEMTVYDYDDDTALKNYISTQINTAVVAAINGTY